MGCKAGSAPGRRRAHFAGNAGSAQQLRLLPAARAVLWGFACCFALPAARSVPAAAHCSQAARGLQCFGLAWIGQSLAWPPECRNQQWAVAEQASWSPWGQGCARSAVLWRHLTCCAGGRTPVYMSPELIHDEDYDARAADVWASGVMLVVMMLGTFPFDPIRHNDPVQETASIW
jgi:Protein kinase domain